MPIQPMLAQFDKDAINAVMAELSSESEDVQELISDSLVSFCKQGGGVKLLPELLLKAYRQGVATPPTVTYAGDTPLQQVKAALGEREADVTVDAFGHITVRARNTEFEMGLDPRALEFPEQAERLLSMLMGKFDERAHLEPARRAP